MFTVRYFCLYVKEDEEVEAHSHRIFGALRRSFNHFGGMCAYTDNRVKEKTERNNKNNNIMSFISDKQETLTSRPLPPSTSSGQFNANVSDDDDDDCLLVPITNSNKNNSDDNNNNGTRRLRYTCTLYRVFFFNIKEFLSMFDFSFGICDSI